MSFTDFSFICTRAALPLCPLVGHNPVTNTIGIQPACYARTIDIANTIIFQGASSFVHIGALVMTTIMLLHIRSKFTAVGRKEICDFFYFYMLLTVFSLILDAGVISPGSPTLPYFVAAQVGLVGATCLSLLINGFVGFQIYEDGTALSVWLLRGCSLFWFFISFLVALLTFKEWGGLGPNNAVGLFVIAYVFNALFLAVYILTSLMLVISTLQDRWPLGIIFFGAFFFIAGQVILYAVGQTICESGEHYVDGLFFATVCDLLAVMMVYKYWDSITKEDLEFSVGTKIGNWEVREPLMPAPEPLIAKEPLMREPWQGQDDAPPKPPTHGRGRRGSRTRSGVRSYDLGIHDSGRQENDQRLSRSTPRKEGRRRRSSHGQSRPAQRDSLFDDMESPMY